MFAVLLYKAHFFALKNELTKSQMRKIKNMAVINNNNNNIET